MEENKIYQRNTHLLLTTALEKDLHWRTFVIDNNLCIFIACQIALIIPSEQETTIMALSFPPIVDLLSWNQTSFSVFNV